MDREKGGKIPVDRLMRSREVVASRNTKRVTGIRKRHPRKLHR